MKQHWLIGVALSLLLLAGCSASNVVKTYDSGKDGVMVTYQELKDGTWQCEDTVYPYRLELTGTLPNARTASHYVVLSHREDVSFEEVSQSILSGVTPYAPEDFCLVEMN